MNTQDKDFDTIRDFIVMASDWEIQQEMALDALHRIRSHPHTSTSNPCIENGCTDTEQCDEICEHSRIYSPAWVKEHDTAIRTEERNKILRLVESDEWQKEHDKQTRNATIKEIIDYISPDLTTGNVVAYLQFLRTQEHP